MACLERWPAVDSADSSSARVATSLHRHIRNPQDPNLPFCRAVASSRSSSSSAVKPSRSRSAERPLSRCLTRPWSTAAWVASSVIEIVIVLSTGAGVVASGTAGAVAVVWSDGVVLVCGNAVGFQRDSNNVDVFPPRFCVRPAGLVLGAGEELVVVGGDNGVPGLLEVCFVEHVNERAVVCYDLVTLVMHKVRV